MGGVAGARAQRGNVGRPLQEAVGPAFAQPALDPLGAYDAPRPRRALAQHDVCPALPRFPGGDEPRDPAADDRDAAHDHPAPRAAAFTRSASASIRIGFALSELLRAKPMPRRRACSLKTTSTS